MPYPRPNRRARAAVIAAACSLAPVTPSRAASYVWTGNGTTFLFGATGNWSPNGQPGAGDIVTFGTGFKSGTDIRIAADQAVDQFIVNTTTPFSISAPSGDAFSLNYIRADSSDGVANVTFNAPVALPAFPAFAVGSGANVTFNNNLTEAGTTGGILTLNYAGIGATGSVTLNAATSLRGQVRVEGATLHVRHPQALGTASLVVNGHDNPSAVHFYADANVTQPLALVDGKLAVHQSQLTLSTPLTIQQTRSAPITVDLTDAGTLTIGGGIDPGTTFAWGLTLAGGIANLNSLGTYAGTITLAAGNTATLQTVASAPNASFLLRENSTLVLPLPNKGVSLTRPISLGFGGGTLSVPGASTFQPAAGQITHSNQTLTKAGTGMLYVTNDANLDTPITVADGSLFLATNLAGTAPITVNTPGILYAGGYLARPLSGSGIISLNTDAYLGNPGGAFSFAGSIFAGANALTLLSTTAATVAGGITLSPGARVSSPNGLSLPASSLLSAPSGNTTLLSPVTAAGSITGPTGTSAITFASDLTSSGTATGNLRLQRAFTSTGTLTAGTLTLDPTSLTTLSGSSAAATTTNHGQLRITAGSHNLGPLTGTGTTTLTGGSLTATRIEQSSLSLTAGSVTLSPSTGTPTASTLSSLTLSPSATLNLNNNPLVLDYTGPANSPQSRVRQYLYDGNLFSLAAALDPDHAHALAYVESAVLSPARRQSVGADDSALVVQLTLFGDANLDGVLNADDYTLLDKGFAQRASTWTGGDFNYDGTVDHNDYLLLDTTYARQQGGTLSPSFLSQRESQFGPAYVQSLIASVPEPTSLVAACGLALLTAADEPRSTGVPPVLVASIHQGSVAPRGMGDPPMSSVARVSNPCSPCARGVGVPPSRLTCTQVSIRRSRISARAKRSSLRPVHLTTHNPLPPPRTILLPSAPPL